MRGPFPVLLILGSLFLACSACASLPAPSLDNFPAMANNAAPGASPKAIQTAKALGRGVNFGNMFEAPNEGDWGIRYQDSFVDAAWDAGFRSVRLPVRWSNHADTNPPFALDANFTARVESAVKRLLDKGFYVVLNMHHYRQLDGDKLDRGEFDVAEAYLDVRFLMLWEQIAQRFAGYGDRLAFELYNEPHGRLNGEAWNVLAARALGVVRKTNPHRIVVIGPTNWNNANHLPRLKLPNDAHLIVTIHNYEPFNFTHQGADWVSPRLPTGEKCCDGAQINNLTYPLSEAQEWAKDTRYPIYVGEFGAYNKADESSREHYTRLMRDEAEARGMSWAYWEFGSSFGVYDPARSAFRPGLLKALLGK